MQSSTTTKERLCEKCCEILNKSNFSAAADWKDVKIDYDRSPANLQVSADRGCRVCQILWLYICFRLDEESLTEKCAVRINFSTRRSSLYVNVKLYNGRTESSLPSFDIDFFDGQKPFRETPPILRLATEHRDDEVRTLMHTTAKLWVDNCNRNHKSCQQALPSKSRFYTVPTRLIDVHSEDQNIVKLIDTENELIDNTQTPYLILSYCWGRGNEPAKTTRDNLDQRKARIAVDNLPKSVCDAITVTRAMGIRYLWVDAVCIIQPNNDGYYDDWKVEAAKMGSYYYNALCCISALCAQDSSDGFLEERYSARYSWRENECIQYNGSSFTIKQPYEMIRPDLENMPLMLRAWVLQERILSTRRLHWTTVGLLWECDGGLFRENEPLRNLRQQSQVFPGAQRDALTSQIRNLPKEEALGLSWFAMLEQYSDMRLTVATDRLAAIHGIASRLSLQHNVEYFGGIFRTYCAQGLVWSSEVGLSEKDFLPEFPSWSWASVSRFNFGFLRLTNKNQATLKSFVQWVEPERLPSVDKITDFSDRSMRRIRLEAPLATLRVEKHTIYNRLPGESWASLGCKSAGPIWQANQIVIRMERYASASSLPATLTLFVCLRSRPEDGATNEPDRHTTYFGIVLEKSEKDGYDAYMRAGSFYALVPWSREANDDGYLEDWKTEIDIY